MFIEHYLKNSLHGMKTILSIANYEKTNKTLQKHEILKDINDDRLIVYSIY